jgi:hypothetical protein
MTRAAVLLTLWLLASVAHAEVLELEGKIKSIDKDARTISVVRKTAKGEKVLDLEVAKKAGELSEIEEGDSVSFSYDPGLEVVTKIAEVAKEPEKAAAVGDDSAARPFLSKMLRAIAENDYDSFVADLTPKFQAELTKQRVAGISAQLAPRMKKGYKVIVLGDGRQSGHRVYLWKLVYEDDGDDTFVRLSLKDGQVTGFLMQ